MICIAWAGLAAYSEAAIRKFIQKIQVGEIVQKVVDDTMENIKGVAIQIELQPLITTELEKITKQVDEKLELAYEKNNDKLDKVIECFEKLACYFDNSIGVSQEAKDNLHSAINEAKGIADTKENIDDPIDVTPIIVDRKNKKNPVYIQEKKTRIIR